ncbi:MAG: SpaA isopeptide-forming pilin-related protein [Hespellia sp.]|nr:SpaA isopeptide-forming pilin-related protein [Hespellia sp.]
MKKNNSTKRKGNAGGFLKRSLAMLLAVAMLATSDMGMLSTAFAQDVSDTANTADIANTEAGNDDAGILPEDDPSLGGETPTDVTVNIPAEDANTAVSAPVDYTNNTEEVALDLYQLKYQDSGNADHSEISIVADNHQVDLSRVDSRLLDRVDLEFQFSLNKSQIDKQVQPGDTIMYKLPQDVFTLANTEAAVAVMNCDASNYEAETSIQIAEYTISNNEITVKFTDGINTEGISSVFGRVMVNATLNQNILTKEVSTKEFQLQKDETAGVDLKAVIILPAKTETEDDTQPAASTVIQPEDENNEATSSVESEKSEIADEIQEETKEEAKEETLLDLARNKLNQIALRVISLFTEESANYTNGNSYGYTYTKEDLPEAFSKVKVKVYNKEGGYQTGDDLRVGFNFGIWMDDDFLYSNFQTITGRPDFPSQGSMSDKEYEKDVLFPYLQGLSESGEIPEIVYDYDLGDDFNQYNITEPVKLKDASDEDCGYYTIKNGVVTFTFDPSSYYYGNIVASVFMEIALNADAVSDDPIEETINKEGEIVHQSIGEIGGGSGTVGDSHYSVEKEGPARVENSEITYTIKATATEDDAAAGDEVLNGKQIVDVLPEGLELKEVFLNEKPLSESEYTYDAETRIFTYTFEALNAEKTNPIASGELKVTVKLNNDKYQQLINTGSINETFTNKASIQEDGKKDPLAVSDEIDTTMKFNFLKKEGSEEGLDGTRYKWTIEANTQLPYLEYGYVADILNWTDQRYDFKTGITVYNDKGEDTTYKNVPYYEGTAGEWTALTAEEIKAYIEEKSITTPFYYLYDSETENPFYIEGGTEPKMKQYAVLIIPFDEFAGTTEPKSMKIQYYTDMNLHDMEMDDFIDAIKENKDKNPEIGNAVNLFWKNTEGGIGPGNRLPDSVTWDKQVDTNVEALTKKAVSYNAQTQMLTWKMDVNRYGASLTDILIEDSLPNATYKFEENGELTIHCYKYNLNTKKQEGKVVTLAKAKGASQPQDGEYALTPDGDNTKLTIKLPDLLVMGTDGKPTAYYYVLDFALKVVDPTLLSTQSNDDSRDHMLGNHAQITAKLNGNEFTDVTDAECKIPNILIDKTAIGSYNYQTHKLSWNVTINPNKLPIKNAEITDKLPEGITWDRLTKITVDGVAVASDKFDEYVTVKTNTAKTVATLELKDKEINETYSFQFDTNVTPEWRDAHIKDASASVEVENKAALSGTVYGGIIDPSTVYDTAKHAVDPVKVTKGGVYDEDTGTVTWTVLLNVDQVNLQNMHLVEDLYFGMEDNAPKIHALDTDSIQVYKVTLDKDGAVKEETEVSTPDIRDYAGSGNSTPSERGFSFYAPTDTEDYATYKITFKTELLAAAKDAKIRNQVYLKNGDGSDNETSEPSDGGYEGNFDADDFVTKDKRPKIKLTKSSANSLEVTADKSLLLDDAKFTITAYRFTTNNNEIILGDEIEKYDKVRLTTGGNAVFLNIKATNGTEDLIYMLKETSAPAGYELNPGKDFVLFTSADKKELYRSMTSVIDGQTTYPLTISNTDPLQVNYYVINSSGTKASDTLAGIVYQDVPVETEFSFTKKILTRVDYKNAGEEGADYTYGAPEEGTVTFKISPNDDRLIGNVNDQYITNDAAGEFTVKGLDAGTYKLTEVQSPTNLSVGAEYALTVSWDGAKYVYEISGTNNKNTYLETDAAGAYTIRDNYVTGKFSFTKMVQYQDEPADGTNPNDNRENLAGVTFTLTSSQIAGQVNTTFQATATSDKNGKVSFTNIPVGVYTLTESAKDGYTPTSACTVTVVEEPDTDNILGKIGDETVYGKKIKVTYSGENLVSDGRYNNTAIKGTITFTKNAYTDITGLTALNTTLSGVEFGLYRKIGTETASKPTYTATSGADGAVSFANVEYGDYVLKEITTPAGYNQVTDITISRSELTIESDHSKFSYTVNSADQGIVKNALIKANVTLTKKDQDGNLLSDRAFNIYRRNSSAIEANGSGLMVSVDAATISYYPYMPNTSVTTDTQGKLEITDLPYGEYVLVEQKQNDQQVNDNTAIYVNVTAEDDVTIRKTSEFAGTKSEDQSYYTAIGDTSTSAWTSVNNKGVIVDALKYGSVQIKKLLAEKSGDALDTTDTLISGVKFKVEKLDASGTYRDYLTLKTNKSGTFTQEDGTYKDAEYEKNKIKKHFLYGTYKFTEVTKSGLLVDDLKSVIVTFGDGSGEVNHGETVYLEYAGTAETYNTEIVEETQEPGKNAFYNIAARATISLKKLGENGEEPEKYETLNDAIFAVYLASDDERKTPIATLQNGSAGIYQLSDENVTTDGKPYEVEREDGVPYLYKNSSNVYMLLEGEYVIKEVNAPAGYKVFTGEIPFTISREAGTVSVATTEDIDDVTFENGQFTVTDHPVELTIEKRDKTDSTKLGGAEFALYAVQNAVETKIEFMKDEAGKYYPDSNGTKTLTTAGTDGNLTITKLPIGSYKLVETKAADGYQKPDDKTVFATFTVGVDGTIKTFTSDTAEYFTAVAASTLITVKNEPTQAIIKKLDDKGNAVTGAKLTLTAEEGKTLANGKESESWTSTAAGWNLTGLITTGVTYTVEETQRVVGNKTAPSAITLKLNADGTLITSGKGAVTGAVVTTAADAATSNTYDAATNTFVMRDVEIRGSIKLTKKVGSQADTTEQFGGISFTFYKSATKPDVTKTDEENEKNTPAADITTDTKVRENITLQTDGTVTVDELTEGYYYFVETSTQDGLCLDTTPTKVVYIGPNQHEATVAVAKENENFVTSVTLTKTDAGDVNSQVGKAGDVLTGVTFTLSKKNADGTYTEKQTLSTGKDGKLTFDITEQGTYQVEETAAITGYELDSAKPYCAEFTVDNTMDFQKKTLDLSRAYDAKLPADKLVIDQYKLKTTNASYAGEGIANTRKSGTVSLKKVDGLNGNALNNVEFELYKKDTSGNMLSVLYKFLTGNTYKQVGTTSWDQTTGSTVNDGVLSISGLSWGDYYIIETNSLPGYVPSDSKYSFTIDANNLEVTLESDTTKHTITNMQTDISFKKTGLINESCSNAEFGGAPVPEATQIMEGVEFTAYTDAAATTVAKFANGNAAVARSGSKGIVTFKNLPIDQTYYIKETKLPERYTSGTFHYKLSTTVYKATLDEKGQFTGLTALDDTAVTNNTVVNDVYRTSISFEKVDEKNPDKKLANSTYGLYKLQTAIEDTNKDVGKESLESKLNMLALNTGSDTVTDANGIWIKIAEAKTDENGMLTFEGVLTNTKYMVKELIAPDGSYVSEKPMQIIFKEEAGNVVIDSIDDGSGTVTVDKDGNIVWLEPQVEVQFAKKDEKENLLAGAALEIRDQDGKVVESWTSSSSEPYTSYGKLLNGETYTLVESKAPNGYYVADPVTFTISSDNVGPNQNKVQYVEMIDKKIPDEEKTTKINNPAVKTGDTMTVLPYILLAAAAIAIIIGVLAFRRKKKRDKKY